MATVTGNYLTIAGSPLPSTAVPRIEVVPSVSAVTASGQVISREPVTVTPNSTTGAFSVNLLPTEDVLAADFHYLFRGYYLAPAGYGDTGHTRHDVVTFKVYVGADGGELGDLIGGVRIAGAWVYAAPVPPPAPQQIRGSYYLDTSDDPDTSGDLYLVV